MPVMLQSCFTGIESTPKITSKDVRKANIQVSAEESFALKFALDSFSRWQPGRQFVISDPKASLTYLNSTRSLGTLSGDTLAVGDRLVFCGIRGVPSILGGNTAELVFVKQPGLTDTLVYRPGAAVEAIRQRDAYRLPFVVDLDVISRADHELRGKELYTKTGRWLRLPTPGKTPGSSPEITGRKFVKVTVDSVIPADENYFFAICFTSQEKPDEKGMLLMSPTVTDGTPALRGFSNLFALQNPRNSYPQITDEHWELIRQGRLAPGMTSQEVMLSLGSPSDIIRRPDQSILYERWAYPGGVYLIFEDGILTRYKL